MVFGFLEQFLVDYYYFYLLIIFLLIILLCYLNLHSFKQEFKNIRKLTLIFLILIFLLAIFLRLFFIEHIFQVYNDGFALINVGEEFALNQKFAFCNSRVTIDCLSYYYNPWPPVMPFIYSLLFQTFGILNSVIFFFNSIIGSLTVVLLFFLTYTIFKNELVSLFAAFVLAVHPIHLNLSGSAALGIGSLFFLSFTLISFFVYLRKKTFSTGLLFFLSFLFFSQIRIENIFLIFFLIPFYLFSEKKAKFEKQFGKLLLVIILFFVLFSPLIANTLVGVDKSVPNWTLSLKDHYLSLKENFKSNIIFLFKSQSTHFIISFLFIVGFIVSFKDNRMLPFMYWLVFLFFFISSYSGGPFSLGSNYHYVLIFFLPFIVISAKGFQIMLNFLAEKQKVILLLVILFILLMWPFLQKDFIFFHEAHLHDKYIFVSNITHSFDSNCLFFYNSANVYDNSLTFSAITNHRVFDTATFRHSSLGVKQDYLLQIKRVDCKKFFSEQYKSSEDKTIFLDIWGLTLKGTLESVHRFSNSSFIFVYDLSNDLNVVSGAVD